MNQKQHRQNIIRRYVEEAIELIDREVGTKGLDRGRASQWHVNPTIWRQENVPEYRVAIPENLNNDFTNKRGFEDIKTRFLTYIPTGRIVYDNYLGHDNALLFEYRLKQSTELVRK